jgi:hypothetical protein
MTAIPARKVHLGCGLNAPWGWTNLNGSWNAWLAKHSFLRGVLRSFHLLPVRVFKAAYSPCFASPFRNPHLLAISPLPVWIVWCGKDVVTASMRESLNGRKEP